MLNQFLVVIPLFDLDLYHTLQPYILLQINKLMVDLNTVINTYGQPLKIEKISDECGVYYSETFYHYKNMTLSVNLEENLGEIVDIIIDENSAFISASVLDVKSVSEETSICVPEANNEANLSV